MKLTPARIVAALVGTSSVFLCLPALADYPALYWWRQPVNYSVRACFNKAETILRQQDLQGIEVGKNDVYGHTDEAAVAVTCFNVGGTTQVVIMVTGSDNTEVSNLREAIKNAL